MDREKRTWRFCPMEKRVTKMIDIRKINQSTYIFITDGNTYIHLGMVIQGVLYRYVSLLNQNMVG